MNIPVLYEDQWLLIVDKPAGLLTIPAPGNKGRSLAGILDEFAVESKLSHRFHLCHRLDRETSGAVIFAKGKAMQQAMMALFKARQVRKTYLAFAHGNIPRNEGRIEGRIEGMTAATGFRVLERRAKFSIVEVHPETGRTNQIRIHFKSIGHPLVGETRFAFRKDFALKAKRVCLHAQAVEFTHPQTARLLRAEAPLPQDLAAFLEKNRE
ncbi:MAG TPA: RluA family pseudouridine synthase [Candidatus Omnitrophota bacterium]|nr:RluA family pseudouridine synthase [Candidatus Omnitrophota bacterium]